MCRAAAVSERALVLGGGGGSGNAWLIGVIAGLFDAGLDVNEADLIIGTSAGSTAAAQITGAQPAGLFSDILSAVRQQRTGHSGTGRASTGPGSNHMERTSAIISAAKDAADMRRKMGAALIEADAPDGSKQKQWRAIVAARLPHSDWPKRPMLITAVDADSGEPAVFDRHSEVDLVDAVAASTAGGFAYRIGDKRYIDGGYRADVNADLATGYRRILVIPPLGARTRKPLDWGLHLEAQVDELRATGSRVETVLPDSNSQNAIGIGMDLMALSRRGPAAQAGHEQGRAVAGQLKQFWR
jgi:NTE family protein